MLNDISSCVSIIKLHIEHTYIYFVPESLPTDNSIVITVQPKSEVRPVSSLSFVQVYNIFQNPTQRKMSNTEIQFRCVLESYRW